MGHYVMPKDCRELLERIRRLHFKSVDYTLYLDTNPDDRRVWAMYRRVVRELRALRRQFNQTCGALGMGDLTYPGPRRFPL